MHRGYPQGSGNPVTQVAPLMIQAHPAPTPITSLTAKKRPAVLYAIRLMLLFCALLAAAQV